MYCIIKSMNEQEMEKEIEVVEEEKGTLAYIGQIFRVLFYIALIYLVWRFFPFSIEDFELTMKGILEPIGSALLILAIVYSLITPHKEEYANWGWFAIWLGLGVAALYGISFLL